MTEQTPAPSLRALAIETWRTSEERSSQEAAERLERERVLLVNRAIAFIFDRLGPATNVSTRSPKIAGFDGPSTSVEVTADDVPLLYVEPQATRGPAVLVLETCGDCHAPTPVGSEIREPQRSNFLAELGRALEQNYGAVLCSSCHPGDED
ncbi:hypothetical protein D3C72_1133840 [compost metagenome]